MPTQTTPPPALSPCAHSVSDLVGTWWIAYTCPNYEKEVARRLLVRDVAYFLPMEHVVKRVVRDGSRRRIDRIEQYRVLFPRYLFACGDDDTWYQLKAERAIVEVIQVVNQARLIRELAQLELALNSGASLGAGRLHEGARCLVTSGPFMGAEGFIESKSGKGYVVLRVTSMEMSAVLEIDPARLERLN